MKKKKKRRRSGLPAIIILTLLLLGVITAGAIFYFCGNTLMLPGSWEREIDLTQQITQNISEYLSSTAYGEEIDVSGYMDDIKITCRLSVTKDGEWNEVIDSNDYANAAEQAKNALKKAVSDMLSGRISDSFIETDMTIDELVTDAVGMSLTKYLEEYGPVVMPSYEELASEYECKATYSASREIITLSSATWGSDKECTYMTARGILVVDTPEGTYIYHKAEEE